MSHHRSSRGSWELETLVDTVAGRLSRPVLVNDAHLRVLAYSAHPHDADPVRTHSILLRAAPPEVSEWLRQWELPSAGPFIAIPGEPALGMRPRLCFPIRADALLLGYLWLVARPDELDDGEVGVLVATAERAGGILRAARQLGDADRSRQGACFRDLLTEAPGAAQALVDAGFEPADGFRLLVLTPWHEAAHPADDELLVRLASALSAARRRVTFHTALYVPFRGGIVAILPATSLRQDEFDTLVGELGRQVATALTDRPGWTASAGVSDEFPFLREAPTAYQDALLAARVAAVEGLGPIARVRDLCAYGLLARMLGERSAAGHVPEALRRLVEHREGRGLIRTLETYLDCAGEAHTAAELLYIHRTTLYQRLRRIERICGLDVRQGEDRLLLHVGLRLLRLSGGPR